MFEAELIAFKAAQAAKKVPVGLLMALKRLSFAVMIDVTVREQVNWA